MEFDFLNELIKMSQSLGFIRACSFGKIGINDREDEII